jgi:Phosphorylase superfamily
VPPSRNVSLHIGAKPGQLASSVLLPGDPLRAKWIADSYLTDVEQHTAVRGMLGFTGRYRGLRISVQGSGMSQPSLAISVQELFADYGVDTMVRVGSCGALTADLPGAFCCRGGECVDRFGDESLAVSRYRVRPPPPTSPCCGSRTRSRRLAAWICGWGRSRPGIRSTPTIGLC